MQIMASAPQMDVVDRAKILDQCKEGSEFQKAQAEVIKIQEQCDRVDSLITLAPRERKAQLPELYFECHNRAYKESGIKNIELLIMGGCAAGFFIGAAAGGMGALPFFGILGALWIGPVIVKGIANKWVLPPKTEAKVSESLNAEKTRLNSELVSAKARFEKAKAKAISTVEQQAVNGEKQTIEDDMEYVIINGIRLPKKKDGILEHIFGNIGRSAHK